MKKIISLLILISVILTSAAMPVFASDNGDLDFAKAFGLISEETAADTPLTRIELAEIFYNIIFPTQNIQSTYWGEADYPDVPAEKKHIVSAVYGMGVMRGYSDTVFAPNDVVTYNQAVKAMVSFLGYDLQAQNMGGYPAGYLTQASRLQILQGGNIPGDTKATYGGICTMLKKALDCDVAIWNHTSVDGTATQQILKGTDYLSYYRGVKRTRGIITGNYLTDIEGGEKTIYFGIYINGYHMEVADKARGIQEKLGYDVRVYYTVEGDKATAVYYEDGINNVLEIKARDIASVSQGSISYYDGNSSVKAEFNLKAPLIYNGTFESSYTLQDLNPFEARGLDGKIKLIDNSGDGVYDTVTVTAFETIVVEDVRKNKIYARHSHGTKVVDLTTYKERNINIRNVTGEPLEISGIRKGHILSLCYDLGGNIKEIIATKDTVTGVIEEVMYAGSKISQITVSGMKLDVSGAYIIVDSAGKFASGKGVGSTAEIFFDAIGLVTLIDLENNYTDGFKAGYLVDAGTEGTLVQKGLCMIFEADGKMTTFDLAERVVLNGTITESATVLEKFKEGSSNDRYKRQFILYKTDLDGKVVTAVEMPKHISNLDEAFDGIYQYPEEAFYYRGGHSSFNGLYLATSTTITFSVPGEENRDKYDRYAVVELPTGESGLIGTTEAMVPMQLYGTEKEGLNVAYAVMSDDLVSSGVNDKRPFFVVSKVVTAIDDDGEEGLKIEGIFVEGASILTRSFFIDEKLFINGDTITGKRPFLDQNETMPSPGDVFRIPSFSSTGKITKMDTAEFYQVYDYDDKTFVGTNGAKHHDVGDGHHEYGTVVKKVGSSVRIRRLDGTEASFALGNRYKFAEVTKNKATGEVSVIVSTADAVLGENTHPGEGSELVIHYRGVGIACFIFN